MGGWFGSPAVVLMLAVGFQVSEIMSFHKWRPEEKRIL
jgi:hypothetical protein